MPGPIRRGPDRRQLIDRLRQHLLPQVLPIPPKQMAQVEYWPWRQRTGGRAPAYILTSPAVAGIKCSDDTGSLPPSRPRSQRRGNPVWSRTLLEERGRKRGGPACPHPPWRFPAFDQGHGNRFFRSIFARQAMSELLVQPRTWLAQHGCHLGAYDVAVRGLAHIPSLARAQALEDTCTVPQRCRRTRRKRLTSRPSTAGLRMHIIAGATTWPRRSPC
jgi:hypothetical protein